MDGRSYILNKLVEIKHYKKKHHLGCHVLFLFCSNVHVVGFGIAVLGMAFELEKMIGKHIKSGAPMFPLGFRV